MLLSRDSKETIVARNQDGRTTIWHCEDRGKGWRIYKVTFSRDNKGCNLTDERMKYYEASSPSSQCRDFKGGCWDHSNHANGQRLTDARFHRILREYCETGAKASA